jgi:hypothetical protein
MNRRSILPLLAAMLPLTLLAACSKDTTAPTTPLKVLVLSDGGTEGHVLQVLGAAGMDTTRGGSWWVAPGLDLSTFDVVVMLNGSDYYHFMADSVQAQYAQYVSNGGGLVVTEWFNYYQSNNPQLGAIMPVGETVNLGYQADTLHPVSGQSLANGLPASITTGKDWTWCTLVPDTTAAKQAHVAVIGDLGGPAVVTGVHGAGRVVAWGMAGVYNGDSIWTTGVDELLDHAVTWAGQ